MSLSWVVVELELEGTEENALRVIEGLLEGNVIQGAINQMAADLGLALLVKSAVSVLVGKKGGR